MLSTRILALRGPNIWARFPVMEVWLDLGVWKDSASSEIPGFNERLQQRLPSLIEHRCSVGERGGFFQRLERGTYLAHIFEHVVLELQTLAGTDVGFGKTRMTTTEGTYKVAFEYELEPLARAAVPVAIEFCLAAIEDRPFDVEGEVAKLRTVLQQCRLSPLASTIIDAAGSRSIPARPLDETGKLLQLGYGAAQRRVLDGQTDRSSAVGNSIAYDRELTRTILQSIGVPVPQGGPVANADEAWANAEYYGLPSMVRPRYAAGGDTLLGPLMSQDEVVHAYSQARDEGWTPLVEAYVAGDRLRLFVVGNRIVAGMRISDATPVDVDTIHPEFLARVIDAAVALRLELAAVDVLALNGSRSLEDQGGVVLAVSGQPDLQAFAISGESVFSAIGSAIVDAIYPDPAASRIPITTVTGTNGKTTTTRLIAHLLRSKYGCVGMTCTEGVYLNDRRLMAGDCSGPKSARMVLQHADSRAAVLETARGGILREGLGFDASDVAVVTNIGEGDHLGLNDIDTTEQLAWVKSTTVWAVAPTGTAVLNASDPLVVAMREYARGGITFFALDEQNPTLVDHMRVGGTGVFVRNGAIVVHEGKQETIVIDLVRVPLTHGGRVEFQVENCLAAVGAARALGLTFDEIRAGLERFDPSLSQLPGRFNLLNLDGVTVVLDYGHNTSALEKTFQVLRQFPHARRFAVYSAAGDRRDIDILDQGAQLGAFFDRVYIYEDTYIRGRQPGEITQLFREGIARASRTTEVIGVQGGMLAIEKAIEACKPGDLLLIQPDVIEDAVAWLQQFMAIGAKEMNLDEAMKSPFELGATMVAPVEPIVLRDCHLGTGAFASRELQQGEVLFRGWGPLTTARSKYTMQVGIDSHLIPPSPLKFLNHSCDPNCGVIIRNDHTEIELHAIRPIAADEELTIDYETFESEFATLTGPCLCGTFRCRGRLRGYSYLPLECRQIYGDYIAEYLRKGESPVIISVSEAIATEIA